MDQFPSKMTPALVFAGNTEYQTEEIINRKLRIYEQNLNDLETNKYLWQSIGILNIQRINELIRKIRKLDSFHKKLPSKNDDTPQICQELQGIISVTLDNGQPYCLGVIFADEKWLNQTIHDHTCCSRQDVIDGLKSDNFTVDLPRVFPVAVDQCIKELENYLHLHIN